jgi:hypothetical protein
LYEGLILLEFKKSDESGLVMSAGKSDSESLILPLSLSRTTTRGQFVTPLEALHLLEHLKTNTVTATLISNRIAEFDVAINIV